MRPSPIAPPGATKPARVPFLDRAPSTTHLEEGPAPRVAGVSYAAASLEPTGSTPSSFFSDQGGCHA
jgi:hypothetical protein